MTNNDIIRKIGRVLYGENWMRPLSRELGCDERQVRRWANDEASARKEAVMRVLDIATKRYAELGEAIRHGSMSLTIENSPASHAAGR